MLFLERRINERQQFSLVQVIYSSASLQFPNFKVLGKIGLKRRVLLKN